MQERDYVKEQTQLYNPSSETPEIVEVPGMNFLKVDGKGDPNASPEFMEDVDALFAASYAIKLAVKEVEPEKDFAVFPLEGLWWVDNETDFSMANKDQFLWTLMVRQPEFVSMDFVTEILTQVRDAVKKPAISRFRFEPLIEHKVVQIMHKGPFAEEGPTIKKLHDFIKESKYFMMGKHHEIYLSDFRKVEPRKWTTIIRQPIG